MGLGCLHSDIRAECLPNLSPRAGQRFITSPKVEPAVSGRNYRRDKPTAQETRMIYAAGTAESTRQARLGFSLVTTDGCFHVRIYHSFHRISVSTSCVPLTKPEEWGFRNKFFRCKLIFFQKLNSW